MVTFERRQPTEAADIEDIVRGVLRLQARIAEQSQRVLVRGTHAKGVCVRAEFEVLDLAASTSDPVLRARLARGLFAQPGTYPAVVRFANGASRVARDRTRDARALSFSVSLPPSLFGPGVTRVDYSMNDGPNSPLNDAHAFAVALRLISARGFFGRFAAVVKSLWPRNLGILLAAAARGARLNRPGRTPYQRLRYWSVTPFRHGENEAVKFSAIPHADNPAQHLSASPDALREELVRHLKHDARMSTFDFGIQLLDVDRMTHRGRPQDAAGWIENASVTWDESQSPFHVVARLRLLGGDPIAKSECEASYFDVSEHGAPGGEPLGSINRARSAAELASRRARLQESLVGGADVAAPTAPRRSRFVAALRFAALVALVAIPAFAALLYIPQWRVPPLEHTDAVHILDQGWGAGLNTADRQRYYYTSQGTGLRGLRYSWFVNLELAWGRTRFADADHMARYGFIVDPPTPENPDGLPVGFAKYFDRQANEDMVDITCAACHTGEIHVTRDGRTTALRIDGGAGLHYFNEALPEIGAAMVSTVSNPLKFNRFARRVLGQQYPEGRAALHVRMLQVLAGFGGIVWRERLARNLYPAVEGHGRTDALARISNMVFAQNLDAKNYHPGDGPVSYPPLWDAWKFDWVQYNASLSQPMARNIGEAVGVGATFPLTDGAGLPLPPHERFRSSASLDHIHELEATLRRLKPPTWPESLLGVIDRPKAERGRALFTQYCATCHGPHAASAALRARNAPLKTDRDPEWVMTTLCVDDVGTDPNAAVNYAGAFVDVSRTGLTSDDLRGVARPLLAEWNRRQATYLRAEIARLKTDIVVGPGAATLADRREQAAALEAELAGLDAATDRTLQAIDARRLPVAAALNYAGTLVRERAYADAGFDAATRADRDGFGILDRSQVIAAYKARPLAGIWSTAPFLHNGSVPTLFDLLSPADERPKTFRTGSRAYDLDKMGLVAKAGSFLFDTALPGNSNRGHEFSRSFQPGMPEGTPRHGLIGPYLEPADRLAIIEYLKIRDDDAEATPWSGRVPAYGPCGTRTPVR